MTERWKSIGKRWCKLCNCFYTDNKPGIEGHENGMRHKNAVQRRIREVQKMGSQKQYEKQETQTLIRQIEMEAMNSMKKDLAQGNKFFTESAYKSASGAPLVTAGKGGGPVAAAASRIKGRHDGVGRSGGGNRRAMMAGAVLEKALKHMKRDEEDDDAGLWAECWTPEGLLYYFNATTQETRYTKPKSLRELDGDEEPGVVNPPPPQASNINEEERNKWTTVQGHKRYQRKEKKDEKKMKWETVTHAPKPVVKEKDEGPDVISVPGHDDPAVTFKQKETPTLKRPASDAAPVGFAKKKKRPQTGRVKKPQ
eukprot:m.28756 g.28756  ORF g.28756 m.28756 type:complete len:310 (-) comp8031_c0_seq1:1367-2296(-)